MMPKKRGAPMLDRDSDRGYVARFIVRRRVKVDNSAGFFARWPWTGSINRNGSTGLSCAPSAQCAAAPSSGRIRIPRRAASRRG